MNNIAKRLREFEHGCKAERDLHYAAAAEIERLRGAMQNAMKSEGCALVQCHAFRVLKDALRGEEDKR